MPYLDMDIYKLFEGIDFQELFEKHGHYLVPWAIAWSPKEIIAELQARFAEM